MEQTVEKVKKAPAKKTTTATPKKTAKALGKTLIVVQKRSAAGAKPGMMETLRGLGLGRPHARRELADTSAVRGMITKVRHLVDVQG